MTERIAPLKSADIIRFLRGKVEFYENRANDKHLLPGVRDENRHTADALEAICYELDGETK